MSKLNRATVFAGLPAGLRDELLERYDEIASNYAARRWEPSELNGGKFCEVVYSIIDGVIKGSFPSKPAKPRDMVQACRALEGIAADPNRVGDRSMRILIPRTLPALYEIRNNRNVGHVGGDVDPNFMDATFVYTSAGWILAELVRVFHNISTQEAQSIVDAVVERKHPLVWDIEGVKRVLDPAMKPKEKTLTILHGVPGWAAEKELAGWVEYSPGMFATRVLKPLHKDGLIEYDRANRRAHISPLGVKQVEERILASRK